MRALTAFFSVILDSVELYLLQPTVQNDYGEPISDQAREPLLVATTRREFSSMAVWDMICVTHSKLSLRLN